MSFLVNLVGPGGLLDPNDTDFNTLVTQLLSLQSLPETWINRKDSIVGIVITAMVLSWICVGLRLYVRLRVSGGTGWDDVLVGLTLMTVTASGIATCLAPDYGLGIHITQIPSAESLRSFIIAFYLTDATYVTSTALIKLSLLFQYLRLYERRSPLWICCMSMILIVSIWGIGFSFAAWVPCFPISDFWNFTGSSRNCYGFGAPVDRSAYVIHVTTNMILDLIVFSLPIPSAIRGSGVTESGRKSRFGMIYLVFLGCFVNVFAAVRLVIVFAEQQEPATSLDPTFFAPQLIVLAMLEVTTASMCASIPIFWPAVNKFIGEWVFITKEVQVVHQSREKLEQLSETSSTTVDFKTESTLSTWPPRPDNAGTTVKVSGGPVGEGGKVDRGPNLWKFW